MIFPLGIGDLSVVKIILSFDKTVLSVVKKDLSVNKMILSVVGKGLSFIVGILSFDKSGFSIKKSLSSSGFFSFLVGVLKH